MKNLNISLTIILVLFITLISTSYANELPEPLAAGWQGKKVCERLHEDKQQRILRCTFAPGVGHEKHFHAAHFGYAISGGKMRLTSSSGTRDVILKTGSSYTSNGVEWHEVLNIGDTTVVYLIVEPKG
ncbi:cupin domain-containing protein [Thalassotalea psychrophila]|uniref:Cupin domain-containing protein n=1 Tax=Thalassotalea psychrophila TaxID=3065647 RepID=A0ABY9TVH7_9GAMM|nr:cupin domain-containing protein [Colwelliaceae bacterium SQ149]